MYQKPSLILAAIDKAPAVMNKELRPKTFQSLLQQELVERCRKNPSYSLRAFAKSLEVSPSALSDMLRAKRPITDKTVEKFGFALGLRPKEIETFKTSAKPRKKTKAQRGTRRVSFQPIALDEYSLIADWYHYAILELIKIDGVRHEPAAFAKMLGITTSEANIAIDRLTRLGLVERGSDDRLRDTSSGFSTNISGNLTSQASRHLQRQILEQAIAALVKLPIEVRNHTSMTMAVDPALLPQAIEKITNFRRELCEFLESSAAPKEVYQLALALFPITQIEKQNRSN